MSDKEKFEMKGKVFLWSCWGYCLLFATGFYLLDSWAVKNTSASSVGKDPSVMMIGSIIALLVLNIFSLAILRKKILNRISDGTISYEQIGRKKRLAIPYLINWSIGILHVQIGLIAFAWCYASTQLATPFYLAGFALILFGRPQHLMLKSHENPPSRDLSN